MSFKSANKLMNVAWSILFSILGIATSLASSYTLKILVDDVLVGHHVEWLWPIQGIFILAVMIGNGFRMLEQHFALRAAKNITEKLRIAMFERLLVGQLSGLRKTNPGDFTSSLLYDAGSVFVMFRVQQLACILQCSTSASHWL